MNREKFQNQYRIASARLKDFDYVNNGIYFVTICTQNRAHFFGHIVEEKMILSPAGQIAQQFWKEIPERFCHASIGDYVIMPNHLHGIILINSPVETRLIASPGLISSSNETLIDDPAKGDAINRVSTEKRKVGGITGDKNPMLEKNLSTIIRWYKGRTSFVIRQQQPDFCWQARFHEHVIRNEKVYFSIGDYINTNPATWKKDEYY